MAFTPHSHRGRQADRDSHSRFPTGSNRCSLTALVASGRHCLQKHRKTKTSFLPPPPQKKSQRSLQSMECQDSGHLVFVIDGGVRQFSCTQFVQDNPKGIHIRLKGVGTCFLHAYHLWSLGTKKHHDRLYTEEREERFCRDKCLILSVHVYLRKAKAYAGKLKLLTCCNMIYTKSLRAHLPVVGLLLFMSDINQPRLPAPFHSVLASISVFFCLYGPFKCISFHKFSRNLSVF